MKGLSVLKHFRVKSVVLAFVGLFILTVFTPVRFTSSIGGSPFSISPLYREYAGGILTSEATPTVSRVGPLPMGWYQGFYNDLDVAVSEDPDEWSNGLHLSATNGEVSTVRSFSIPPITAGAVDEMTLTVEERRLSGGSLIEVASGSFQAGVSGSGLSWHYNSDSESLNLDVPEGTVVSGSVNHSWNTRVASGGYVYVTTDAPPPFDRFKVAHSVFTAWGGTGTDPQMSKTLPACRIHSIYLQVDVNNGNAHATATWSVKTPESGSETVRILSSGEEAWRGVIREADSPPSGWETKTFTIPTSAYDQILGKNIVVEITGTAESGTLEFEVRKLTLHLKGDFGEGAFSEVEIGFAWNLEGRLLSQADFTVYSQITVDGHEGAFEKVGEWTVTEFEPTETDLRRAGSNFTYRIKMPDAAQGDHSFQVQTRINILVTYVDGSTVSGQKIFSVEGSGAYVYAFGGHWRRTAPVRFSARGFEAVVPLLGSNIALTWIIAAPFLVAVLLYLNRRKWRL